MKPSDIEWLAQVEVHPCAHWLWITRDVAYIIDDNDSEEWQPSDDQSCPACVIVMNALGYKHGRRDSDD